MNSGSKLIHSILPIALMALAFSCAPPRRGVVLETVNIIKDPEMAHAEKIGKLRPGDEITISAEKEFDGEKMYRIAPSDSKEGWISAAVVKISEKKGPLVVGGFAIIPAVVLDDPSKEKPSILARLARGESFKAIREKEFNGKEFVQVGIAGVEEVAWVEKDSTFIGEKQVLTATNDTKIYDRPDKSRRPVGTIPVGKRGYLIDKDGEFVKFNVWKDTEHWVLRSSVLFGSEKVKPKVAIQGFGTAILDASSWVDDDIEGKETVYSPKQAFDGTFSTSWQTSVNGGMGEWISVSFIPGDSLAHPVISISIVNGFAKTEELYNQNNRITQVKLVCYGIEEIGDTVTEATLQDNLMDFQNVGFCTDATGFKLQITGVAKGSRWQDAAISEIRLETGP